MDYNRLYADIMLRLKEGLSPVLHYHGVHHTIDVMAALSQIGKAEGVGDYDMALLKTAALLHDSGFLSTYTTHEEAGCNFSREILPSYGYSDEEITIICGMIMSTKIPQSPKTKLEEIICDADLDYLGRSDFYPIANSLFKELQNRGSIGDENEWNKLQIRFLSAHSYFTQTSRSLREPEKLLRIEELKRVVGE
jgi:uncharacterized protein